MRLSLGLRFAAVALLAALALGVAPAAHADSGRISIKVLKGGFIVGASGGSGTLTFRGKSYPLSIGGLSAGLVIGASETTLTGSVSNINRASDVEGVYAAIGAGAAVGGGAQALRLRNGKGALLRLSGKQVGLMADIDLSGLAISLK